MNFNKWVLHFNLIFILLLILLSLVYPKIVPARLATLRSPSIFSDVERDSSAKGGLTKEQQQNLAGRKNGKVIIRDYLSDTALINASGDAIPLQGLMEKFSALKKDKTKKIRIGYFGDSFIEGDLITKDLREQLQNMFGGSGVGFVPVTSITAGFRTSITHGFSGGWNDINFKSDERKTVNLFLSGHAFFSEGTNTVNYRAVQHPLLDSFGHMEVLYGMPKNQNSQLQLNINGIPKIFKPAGLFNTSDILLSNSKAAEISTAGSDVPLYGFSFESEGGIVLDNFSFRGITGVEINNISDDMLAEIDKKRPYDLIVLQYGPNLLFRAEPVDFSWYRKMMEPVLKKLKKAFPQTDFLVISTADKAFNYGGEWKTQRGVEPLVDIQYEMAHGQGMDFYNLYHSMGGNGGMIKWVNEKPALANRDYTHVNGRGAKKIADYLFTAIINEYHAYDKPVH